MAEEKYNQVSAKYEELTGNLAEQISRAVAGDDDKKDKKKKKKDDDED